MNIIGQLLLGSLIISAGIVMIMKNYQVANAIPLPFFEQKLGPGSSYLVWKIFSIIAILGGMLVFFGLHNQILTWMISPLTNIVSP